LRLRSCRLILAFSAVAASLPIAFPAGATMPTPAGTLPREVAEAIDRGISLPARGAGLGVSAVPPAVWRIPIILAAFADEELTYSAADFDSALFGTRQAIATGSVRDYYRWVSGGRLDVTGRVVATVRLPGTMAYYGDGAWGLSGRPQNSAYGALLDALQLCQRDVDWTEFDPDHNSRIDMLWFVHAGKGGEASLNELPLKRRLWSFTSALSRDPSGGFVYETTQLLPGSTTAHYKIDPFASLPEISGLIPGRRSEIGVYCHEFGHALGLPDLYDNSTLDQVTNVGPGNWSLMSTGQYGGNGLQPEAPSHMGGWASSFLGWSQIIRPAQDTTIRIAPLSSGGPVVEFWFQGEANPEHFLLENRTRDEFDRSLVRGGLIVTHVDDALIAQRMPPINHVNTGPTPGVFLVEADGNNDLFLGHNRGDVFDPFPGDSFRIRFDDETRPNTHTFKNAVTNIGLSDITLVGNDIQLTLRVRAPGWLPAEDHSDPDYQPYPTPTVGRPAAIGPDGSIDAVASEVRGGRPQIVLHRRTSAGWSPGTELSSSPVGAVAPSITPLPGGDAAVAWSDYRGGRSRIWGRVRLQGEWTPERLISDVPGENGAPAIGADGHGRVYLTWLNTQNGERRVYFTRFVYFAPFGQPLPVTALGRQPDNPTIAVDEDGISYIMWPDLADNPRRLWFTRFHPDSGLSAIQTLTATSGAESGASALVDAAGTVHLVWQVTTTERNEIHYQRRFKTRRPAPRDTVLVSSGAQVGSPSLALDPSETLHLAYEFGVGGANQILYKRSRPGWGWDYQGTEVSSPADGSAGLPCVLAESMGNVSVLYTGFGDLGPRFIERRRQLDVVPPQAAPLAASAPSTALALRPNPLRAGQEFELEWDGAPPAPGAMAELFDVAGRRVSAAALERRGAAWRARFSGAATARLTSGIYFVRPWVPGAQAQRLVVLR